MSASHSHRRSVDVPPCAKFLHPPLNFLYIYSIFERITLERPKSVVYHLRVVPYLKGGAPWPAPPQPTPPQVSIFFKCHADWGGEFRESLFVGNSGSAPAPPPPCDCECLFYTRSICCIPLSADFCFVIKMFIVFDGGSVADPAAG